MVWTMMAVRRRRVCLSMFCFGGVRAINALRIIYYSLTVRIFVSFVLHLLIYVLISRSTAPHRTFTTTRVAVTFVSSSTLSRCTSDHIAITHTYIHIRYPYALPLSRYLLTQCTVLPLAPRMQWIELLVESELRNTAAVLVWHSGQEVLN